MAITPSDISSDYTIKFLSGSIKREDRILTKVTPGAETGKKVTLFCADGDTGWGSSGVGGEQLRISDGSTTITYTCTETGGSDAGGATQIGIGSDRAANFIVDEFVSKINSSALDVTAVDNGGNDINSSFTLTPGAGKTLTITEDPSGDGEFGTVVSDDSFSKCSVEAVLGSSTTTKFKAAPFRFLSRGIHNLRGQSQQGHHKIFIGEQKT